MYHDFTVRLCWLADTKEWRIYTDAGQYYTAKSIEEIPNALSRILEQSAQAVQRMPGFVKADVE